MCKNIYDGTTFDATPRSITETISIIRRVVAVAGDPFFTGNAKKAVERLHLDRAILRHDTAPIFDWLLTTFSYQGISDSVARNYMDRHGTASWSQLNRWMADKPSCPRLENYWAYNDCRYDKTSISCREPEHFDHCPVPRLRLRNGRLNQTAFSFFLFVRDIAGGDLIGWLDDQVAASAIKTSAASPQSHTQSFIVEPLRHVYGVSDKILSMTLSGLFIGVEEIRPTWFVAGCKIIAIDTLVHNFMHRTGILDSLGAGHQYGAGCYGPYGCAAVIQFVSEHLDARLYSEACPAFFPRFIQHAIWHYCAADGLNICNGNRIGDRASCVHDECHLFGKCARLPLKNE